MFQYRARQPQRKLDNRNPLAATKYADNALNHRAVDARDEDSAANQCAEKHTNEHWNAAKQRRQQIRKDVPRAGALTRRAVGTETLARTRPCLHHKTRTAALL